MLSLIYHDVVPATGRDSSGFPGDAAAMYKLAPEAFSEHLAAICASGARVGLCDERPQAMLTFDDGGSSSTWIAEELERHGLRGTFFVVTDRLGTTGFMDERDVRELVERGHQVGSHSHTHPPYMARLQASVLRSEWSVSREILTEVLGFAPQTAAVPGGSVSPEVVKHVARAGYTRLFTSTPRTRSRISYEIEVLGRYTVWATDPPELAAALVTGAGATRARRFLAWQLKSAAKRVSPGAYERARRVRAGRKALVS